MTIAFVISAYRLPGQLMRLVSALEAPGRSFFVHVDRRSPAAARDAMAAGLARFDHVHLLPSHACPWGGFGHVRATLKGLERIVDGRVPAEYILLLTGQDYPIKPDAVIDDVLGRNAGRSFMNHRPLPVDGLPAGGYDRIDRQYVSVLGRIRALPPWPWPRALRRRVPYGLTPYFGSGYWCLHRSAVEHVVSFIRSHPGYVRFFAHAYVPDEMFFQTILLNSPLAPTIVNDDLRFIRWPGPAVLTSADWDAIAAAPDLFARKFDETVDAAVLDRIDRDLRAPASRR